MDSFEHQRHKAARPLERARELVIACPPLRSNVNLARIMRAASCCGIENMIVCGKPRIDPKVARDAIDQIRLDRRRTLLPALQEYRERGYRIVGLEQTSHSQWLPEYQFERRAVLVIGQERQGLSDDLLAALDDAVEIPVYGLPHSFNVATATAMALYEYCRQFPLG